MDSFEKTIVGKSPAIKTAMATAKKIARSSSITTLIVGESGTGKDLFARLIHNLSATNNQPFVDINCGAIPETLLESELFGYEKGAFTGAQMRKQGLFELANGGTIFLDEIGNTTAGLQMKLLKAVENKRFRRVSGVEEIRISTRIIAATNVDLRESVELGKFREDLYYRLNVSQIRVPPLRERGDDILLLAEYFIEHFNREYDRQVRGVAPEAIQLMQRYTWPGNVRQLKNAIERAILVESDEWIEAAHLHLDAERKPRKQNEPRLEPIEVRSKPSGFSPIEIPEDGLSLEELERNLILSALEKANGNLSQAARLLKIRRGKLRYRIERMGLTPKELYSFKVTVFS